MTGPVLNQFNDPMTSRQIMLGRIYLPVHIFVLPILLAMLQYYFPDSVNDVKCNIIYYAVGFLFCMTALRGSLRKSFDGLLDGFFRVIISILSGFFFYIVLSWLSALAIMYIAGDSAVNPNNEAAQILLGKERRVFIGLAVMIAPVVEETLFRGVAFGPLLKKSRLLAYTVSIVLFGLYHVWQYALVTMDPFVLVFIIQYIPAGVVLGRCYEQTGTIWAPIFLHMFLNYMALQVSGF